MALAAVLLFCDFYIIPTDSMRPTIAAGDVVWCVGGSTIRRGDIVVFALPDSSEKGVKRVIGLPGDTVDYVGKQLSVNGQLARKIVRERLGDSDAADLLLEQTFFDRTFNILELYGQSLTEARSTAPGYFLLGDNRDSSIDSRQFGRLVATRVRCKVLAVIATEAKGRINFSRTRWL